MVDPRLPFATRTTSQSAPKVYAKSNGRSLSDLVENYLKLLTRNSSIEDSEYTPRVKSLLGCITLPEDFDYKKEVADYLTKKYL